MPEDPFAKLGALDQKLFQSTPSPTESKPLQSTKSKVKRSTPSPTDPQTLKQQEAASEQTSSPLPDQPASPPISPLISSLASGLVPQPGSQVVQHSKQFYISERLDKRIDEAVRYFQERHSLNKADRSIVVTAFLDN